MEIQIYLAKFVRDIRRNEPRNVGLIIRTADDQLFIKFLLEEEKTCLIPKGLNIVEFSNEVLPWREQFDKYGIKALNWVGKRKKDSKYFIEFSHGEMVQELDFDKLFYELVM